MKKYDVTDWSKQKYELQRTERELKEGAILIREYHETIIPQFYKLKEIIVQVFDHKHEWVQIRLNAVDTFIESHERILNTPNLLELHEEINSEI